MNIKNNEKQRDEKKSTPIFSFIIILILIVILVLGLYFFHFHEGFAKDIPNRDYSGLIKDSHAIFGQFGDFFGGVLNPILTAVNILLLVYFNKEILDLTIKQQENTENNHYLSEDKEQIFKLIENHRHILLSIKVSPPLQKDKDEDETDRNGNLTHRGIDAFWYFRAMIATGYTIHNKKNPNDYENNLKEAYDYIYNTKQQKQYFGHYFRNLFHVFKFIESSRFNKDEQKEYAEIVRAQLSYLELHFLFLNCLIDEGSEFKRYVKKFELLKELQEFEFNINSKIDPIKIDQIVENWKE
ncbi:putative phage abortive infection protein [Neisseria cinerea]|uniref:Putative phage abortive infection protein n=1 Tax=Neisseria cinerea TaxID=483 RepID=A0A7T3BNY7_NEICI|nr:putative phage abortive infection protein [Neisseria cinerea]QPT38334.1 putative phage abortive infection protein [Neisseria cinerea]SQF83847.1 Uncharacterised protein [Neisseria cinerea]